MVNTQKGNINCVDVEYVLIKYGSFYEFIISDEGEHVFVKIEQDSDIISIAKDIQS